MADTQRSVSAILALLADNSTGAISPQDIRDAFVSWRMGMGQIYVADGDGAAVSISDSAVYYETTTSTWTLSSGGVWCDESAGNGRLTYTGTADVMVHAACTISFSVAGTNQDLYFRLGKNATPDPAAEVRTRVATSAVASTAIHLVTMMSTGDYLSLWARNTTSTADITLQVANMQFVTMPM